MQLLKRSSLLLLASGVVVASSCSAFAVDVTCEFASVIRFEGNKLDKLSPTEQRKPQRFRFAFDKVSCRAPHLLPGTYVNDLKKWKGEVLVQCVDDRITVVENVVSDNLFIVTVFTKGWGEGRKAALPAPTYPAIFSFQGWNAELDHYRPQMAFGSCWIL